MRRMIGAGMLAVIIILAACSSSAGTATPTPWMTNANLPGEVIYLDAWEDGMHLCLIQPDRGGLRCEALGEQLAINFTWSADGSRVVYLLQPINGGATEVWAAQTSDLKSAQLILDASRDYPSAPAITADGRWLVVETKPLEGGKSDLLSVDLTATSTVQPILAANSANNDSAPDISPTAARLAFVSDRVEEGTTTLKIYSANLDGSDLRRLTAAVGVESFAPSWSPDGKQIAFLRRSAHSQSEEDGLWVIDADGSNLRQLAKAAFLVSGSDAPSWSPDGKWLAFLQGEEDGGEDLVSPQVWVVAVASGGLPVQLSQGGTTNFLVSWSPDSRALLYTQRDGQDYFLYMVKPDGSDRQKFIECSLCAFGSWSPK